MKNENFAYSGRKMRGLPMLFVTLAVLGVGLWITIEGSTWLHASVRGGGILLAAGIVLCLVSMILAGGFMLLEPNEARVMLFFGQYRGTFYETGYWGSTLSSRPSRFRCGSATSMPSPSRSTTRAATPS